MAYINVAEWTSDQVTEWLKGLDNSMYQYTHSFTNNGLTGKQLLNIRPYELEQLGIKLIGHQEIILEAVEYLRNFHYNLEKENLQYLAMHVRTASYSLTSQLHEYQGQYLETQTLKTQTLKDITRLISQMKSLIRWLDHTSFKASHYTELRNNFLRICLELATSSQRDRFMKHPVDYIKQCAIKLTNISMLVITMEDSLVIQPCSLELVTLKKRENDVGFLLMNTNCGIQRVTEIKFNSPAYHSGKIEDGDEIVQINYQTVVGWNNKRVIMLLQDSPPDVLITLKAKPNHTPNHGHIYLKPYRLPSKKRSLGYRWGDLPSPREFGPIPELPTKKAVEQHISDSESSSSEIMTPTDDKPLDKELRLYMPKPRAVLQRRHSISGDQYSSFKSPQSSSWFLHEAKSYTNNNDSPSLRDKSVSFGFGLELTPRPTTCLGIGASTSAAGGDGLKGSLPEMITKMANGDKGRYKPGVSKVVRFESNMKLEEHYVDTKYTCNVDNTVLETFEPIPYVDEEVMIVEDKTLRQETPPPPPLVPEVPVPVVNREVRRGKLDKSFSTPAYGSDTDSDTPPAIEPRKEHLQKIPPVPPPRPRKLPPPPLPGPSSQAVFIKPQIVASPIETSDDKNKSKMANVIDLKSKKDPPPSPPSIIETAPSPPALLAKPKNDELLGADSSDGEQDDADAYLTQPCSSSTAAKLATKQSQIRKIPATKHFLEEPFELTAPVKNKTLTLKKKNSLIAKRRMVSLKTLDTNEIQGHLYRRAKDRHGSTYWARYYFVLVEYVLYGFRTKESSKADFLIFLSGFTVSLAKEVHSKPFAFKVYHPSKSFYFAAETAPALSQWMEYIRLASMKGGTKTNSLTTTNWKELFSETDSSDDDLDLSGGVKKHWATPSPSAAHKPNGAGSDADSVSSINTPVTTKTESSYHLNFGSLKKFAKSSLAFSNNSHGGDNSASTSSTTNMSSSPSESKFLGFFTSHKSHHERKVSSDIPQPTSQFKSYRKVAGNTTIGGGGSGALVFTPNLFTNHQNLENFPPMERSVSNASTLNLEKPTPAPSVSSIVEKIESIVQEPPIPAERLMTKQMVDDEILENRCRNNLNHIDEIKKSYKTMVHNFMHASNPNLVEFDFPTSKSIDFSGSKIHSPIWDDPTTKEKAFTLKDLMLQKQQEEAQDMYNKRVFRGVEKAEDTLKKMVSKSENNSETISESAAAGISGGGDMKINKIQKRSLPITPDYAQSFKPDDQEILYTRSSEGQKLRDFGYELISGEDSSSVQKTTETLRLDQSQQQPSWSAKRNDRVVPGGSTKKKSFNWITSSSSSSTHDDKSASVRSSSFKKSKSKPSTMSKFDNLKASSEKIFQFKTSNGTNDKDVYNKSRQTEKVGTHKIGHFDDVPTPPFQYGVFQSNSMRKNSAPERVSYFSKMSFPSSQKSVPKDKTLLGSPRLHRAIFGRSTSHEQHSSGFGGGLGTDHEIFSPVVFPHKIKPEPHMNQQSTAVPSSSAMASSGYGKTLNTGSGAHATEYPGLEYPPVFEPETYSLSDPNTTLLKRRYNNHTNQQ